MQRRDKPIHSPNRKIKIIYILAIVVFLTSLVLLLLHLSKYLEAQSEYKTLQASQNFEGVPEINFELLDNPDTVGWIFIPGTEVNYPIVQKDNNYYLTHTYQNKRNPAGAIFLDANNNGFNDSNTVIYGHNMRDGSMFAGLNKYQAEDFFNAHRDIYIITPSEIRHYVAFSCYKATNTNAYRMVFNSSEEYENYKSGLKTDSLIETDINPAEKEILTLSTCTSSDKYHFIIHALRS